VSTPCRRPRSPSKCAPAATAPFDRAAEIDAELRACLHLLKIADEPHPGQGALNLLGHEVGGYRRR